MAIAMPTEGLNGVLAATGARTAEHMKELLKKDVVNRNEWSSKTDLEVMRELQETLKDRSSEYFIQKLKAFFGKIFPEHVVLHPTQGECKGKARCEKEKEHCDALRTLERRLKEGEEEDGD